MILHDAAMAFQPAVNRITQSAGAFAVHDPYLIVFGQNGIVQIFLQIGQCLLGRPADVRQPGRT